MAREYYKCQYNQCTHGGEVHIDEMVIIEENGKKKRFHKDCLSDYNAKKNDREYLNKLCAFLEKNYMNKEKLTKGMVRRLQAIRANKKFIKRGDKIPFRPNDGNSYKLIVLTVLNYKNEIEIALRGKEFKDSAQRFNYICAIISDKVPKVKEAIIMKREESKQLDNISNNEEVFKKVPEYKINKDNKEDKLKDRFNNMW